jgi:lipid II isoglutaminyl synthase (glutamine-hydrolysing)
MKQMSALRVCVLYPDHLSLYADRGNLLVLKRRCQWRGIGFSLTSVGVGDTFEPTEHDLFYLGGGQASDQRLCAEDLAVNKRIALHEAAGLGAVIVGICGGYQLLGHELRTADWNGPGAGILDICTDMRAPRLIGTLAASVDLGWGQQVLVGFENHAGRTHLGPNAQPLGQILVGHGNNGCDGHEGAREGKVVGTYLHGPVLAANAWFADWLISMALSLGRLPLLEDDLERLVHQGALDAAGVRS